MILFIGRIITKFFLSLRYRIHVSGLDECLKLGNKGILFLPNHPALIDPVILSSVLVRQFKVRALANEKQIRTTVLSASPVTRTEHDGLATVGRS